MAAEGFAGVGAAPIDAPHKHDESLRVGKKPDADHNRMFVGGFLNPHGNLKLFWDFCMVVFLCYTMFSEPVFMGFAIDPTGPLHVMEYVVIAFFLSDVCLNFRTAFENSVNKTLVANQRQVAFHYLTGWFLIDMCASFPIELFLSKTDGGAVLTKSDIKVGTKIIKSTKFTKAFKIMRLLKLTKLARTVHYIHEIEDFLGTRSVSQHAVPSLDQTIETFAPIALPRCGVAHTVRNGARIYRCATSISCQCEPFEHCGLRLRAGTQSWYNCRAFGYLPP